MSLHNSCAGNKPVITGGWGSGQAGRGGQGGEGGQTCLPAPVLGFRPPSPPPHPPAPLHLFIMQTRIASLLEVGLHFKGAPCLPCLRCPPCLPKPQHPKPGAPVAWPGWGNRGAAAAGQPRWETPALCDIGPTELSATLLGCPRSAGDHPASVYPLTTPRGAGTPGTGRDTRPATQQPGWATPRLAPR